MAAATGALITGGIGLGLGAYQAIAGNKMRRSAQRELNSYERQALDNVYEDIGINTAGSDLILENGQQGAATMVDAAQQGGSRSIIGAIPRVGSYLTETGQQAARNLDSQYINRDYAIAGDNATIRGINENRDNQTIAALSSEVNAGRQDMFGGLMGIGSSISQLGRSLESNKKTAPQPVYNTPSFGNAIYPQGPDSPWFDLRSSYPKV